MRNRMERAGGRVGAAMLPLLFVGVVFNAAPAGAVPTVSKSAALQMDADSDTQISPGDTLQYTVRITDTGTANAVMFGDPIPDPNTTLVVGTVTTTQGTVLSGNGGGETVVGVNVGTISNQTVTITFDVTIKNPLPAGVNQVVDQGGVGCDTCGMGIPSDDPNTDAANDPTITPVVASPDLTVTKTAVLQMDADSDTQVSPGDTLRYTVTVTNSGNEDAMAVFADGIPDTNTTLVVGSVTTTLGMVVTGNAAGDTAVVVNLGTVAGGGGAATVTFDTTIKNPLPAGVNIVGDQGVVECPNCTPQAQPTDDPNTATPNDPTLTPVVAAPDVAATKVVALVVDLDVIGEANPGDVLEYTVIITNTGNQDAAAIMFNDQPSHVTDLLVGSVTTTAGAVTIGNNPGDTSVQVLIPTLAGGGGSVTITYRVQVGADLIGIVPVRNQGNVSGANVPPLVTDDPGTSEPNDATVILAVGPSAVPALGAFGLIFAIIVLGGVAAVRMRRIS